MKSFYRALQLAFQYPFTMCGAFATSFLIAALWGGNIGALYPIFAVVLEGKSLQAWVDEEIASGRAEIERLKQEQAARRVQPERAAQDGSESARQSRQQAIERDVARFRRIEPFVDRFLPQDPFQTVVVIVALLMLGTVIKDACIVSNMVLVARLMQNVAVDLQRQFYEHVLRSDPQTFHKRGTSGLMNHMGADIMHISTGLNNLFGGAVREPLKMLACLIGAAWICWPLLLISLLLAPLAAVLIRSLAGSLKRANRRSLEQGQLLHRLVFESFNGLQTVQAYTMEDCERERYVSRLQDCVRKAMRIVWYSALSKPATEVLGLGVVSLALLTGAYLVLNQETHLFGIRISDRPISLESLLVFYGLLVGISDPARKLSEVFGAIQGGVAAAERYFPVLDEAPRIADPAQPRKLPRPHRRLAFDDVNFHYTAGQPTLRQIQLEIPFGETLAIVGPNGCGKSTLAGLIPRFYDPVSGRVRLDDVDLRELRLRDLRQRIGVVAQHAVLFDDTVRANIRYGSPQATDDQVLAAAKQAYAHTFITEKLEHGYETVVGQNGARLSGGQKQRLALARAMLRDPEILILDEATSQVDLESEQLIHRALERFIQHRTTIIITHRLSTLALADRIVVMDEGTIQDMGTHEALYRRCELYRRLHELQFKQSA